MPKRRRSRKWGETSKASRKAAKQPSTQRRASSQGESASEKRGKSGFQHQLPGEIHYRYAIWTIYISLGAPPETEWNGVGGTVATIRDILGSHRDTIRRVLKLVNDAESREIKPCNDDVLLREWHTIDEASVILPQGCGEVLIAARLLNNGSTMATAHRAVNGELAKKGKSISYSYFYRVMTEKYGAIPMAIQTCSQGSTSHRNWMKARLGYSEQILERLRNNS